ncbi:MAG: GGDEF domain-containing protein [Candidatus Hydrogenedentota bacterium]|nr:MAG: GGDEF domain-containing protein [Candidatus Hydrogenedentota bacterium]
MEIFIRRNDRFSVRFFAASIFVLLTIFVAWVYEYAVGSGGAILASLVFSITFLFGGYIGGVTFFLFLPFLWFVTRMEPMLMGSVIVRTAYLGTGVLIVARTRRLMEARQAYEGYQSVDSEGELNHLKNLLLHKSERVEALRRGIKRMEGLAVAAKELNAANSVTEVARILADYASRGGREGTRVVIFAVDDQDDAEPLAAGKNGEIVTGGRELKQLDGQDFNPYLLRRRINIFVEDVSDEFRTPPLAKVNRDVACVMAVPMVIGDKVVGIIRCESDTPRNYEMEDLRYINSLAVPGAIALENARLYSQTEEHAKLDGLTGVFRRGRLEARLDWEIKRAIRYGKPLSVLLLDVDHFKSINDSYGHVVGDDVLRRMGGILKENFSEPYFVGRYGGEEFLVLMPNHDTKEAKDRAEAFRRRVEETTFGEKIKITISGGIATCPKDAKTDKKLLKMADRALYCAKESGRNRIEIFNEGSR